MFFMNDNFENEAHFYEVLKEYGITIVQIRHSTRLCGTLFMTTADFEQADSIAAKTGVRTAFGVTLY